MTEKLNGRYELGDVVGAGGMGAVYRATDTRLGRIVAVKALRGGALADDVARSRMRSEARLASTVHHPGVAQIFDYDDRSTTHGGMAFIVMEFVDGQSLAQLLRERGTLPVDEVMSIVRQVADALTAAHAAGVVHRDLKPANIMLTPTGRAVLVDFGIASSATSEPLTATGALIGTADYLSPEQAAGRSATPRSDLYALGVVAHQCLTGVSPFRRDHHVATALAHLQDELPALDQSVPPRVRELVHRLAEKNPVDRPADAASVVREADLIGAAASVDVSPTATMPGVDRDRARRPVALYAGAGLVVAALLAIGAVQLTGDTPPEQPKDVAPVEQVVATPSVDVSADRLVGLTAEEATSLLEGLGLVVTRRDVSSSSTPGRVVGVDPTGQVPRGATVTLDVAVASPTPSPKAPSSTAPSTAPSGSSGGGAVPAVAGTGNDTAKGKGTAKNPGNGKGRGGGKGDAKARGKGKGGR